MKICFVSGEADPFIKTGGLADVSGSLPLALEKQGIEVILFLPLYDLIDKNRFNIKSLDGFSDLHAEIGNKSVSFGVSSCKIPDSEVVTYFIDCPQYFYRGKVYTNDPDEDERFILFQKAVLITLEKLNRNSDIIHCNDWQTALIPAFLKKTYKDNVSFANVSTVFSIHNIAYQGMFDKSSFAKTNLPENDFQPMGPFELYGNFCFLKAGISYSDIVTTVSSTYAKEIQTQEYGCGLEGILINRQKDLFGIINGINNIIWNPALDKLIPHNYSFETIKNKTLNKKFLLEKAGLKYSENTPLLGIVSRFAWQKGFELIEEIIEKLVEKDLYIVILGEGEKKYEDFFRNISEKYPGKIKAFVEYNNELAHLITTASDIFLMPSKYEPCGLNQMYSLQYGTVPVVRKTGGLADTVKDINEFGDKGNGFTFTDFNAPQFLNSIERALYNYEDIKKWQGIIKNGMSEDFSWNSSALKYIEIYKKANSKSNA